MPTLSEEICSLIQKTPGLTDREITDRLHGRDAIQQPINQAARTLEAKGKLKRTPRHDGRIGNYPLGAKVKRTTLPEYIPPQHQSKKCFKQSKQEVARKRDKEIEKMTSCVPQATSSPVQQTDIVLISCVKSKRTVRCAAKDMYTSPLFQKMLSFARRLKPKAIFILSAKYGLLQLDTLIDPYEQTLGKMSVHERHAWAKEVMVQLQQCTDTASQHFTFLAGKPYREILTQHITHTAVPMDGLSFGRQLHWLEAQIS